MSRNREISGFVGTLGLAALLLVFFGANLNDVMAQGGATATPQAASTVVATVSAAATVAPTVSIQGTTATNTGWLSAWLPTNADETRKAFFAAAFTAIFGLIAIYFQKLASFLKRLLDSLWQRLKIDRAVESRYRKRVAHELRTVQILTMPEEKRLESFFIPLRLVGWVAPDLKAGNSANGEPISLNEALQEFERITIVGEPGAGKTTITSHTAASIAEGKVVVDGKLYLPVYVQLRRLKDFLESESYQEKSLEALLCESLDMHGFPHATDYLSRKLDDGCCLIVLDGYDELADREGILQQRLANKVKDFVDTVAAGNRVILTSRSPGYVPAWFSGFRVLEMSDLSIDQAKTFAAGWFGEENVEKRAEFEQALDSSDRLQLLVTNPLMLAIICFVLSNKESSDSFLPNRRVDVYDKCFAALIIEWDRSRGVNRDAKFSPEEIETVLRYVAYDGLRSQRADFPRKDLLALIRSHLPKAKRRITEDKDFLNEVLQHTGLFKEKGEDVVGFLHLTFQEYLAAQVIRDKVLLGVEKNDIKAEISEVLENAINPSWSEPIALAAGILRGRTELVTVLFEEARLNPSPELRGLLALCMRDADLEDLTLDEGFLQKQDEIISGIVEVAAGA